MGYTDNQLNFTQFLTIYVIGVSLSEPHSNMENRMMSMHKGPQQKENYNTRL